MKRTVIVNTAVIICNVIIIVMTSVAAYGQDDPRKIKRDYFGFAISMGTRSSTLHSNYTAINKMEVLQDGATVGLLWGSRGFQTRLSGGYFSSNDHVAHTTDLMQLEVVTNVYPLYIIQKRWYGVEPYLVGGISKNYYKFYGFYTNEQTNANNNYSVTIEPYLGNLNGYNAVAGVGLEINLLDQYEFCKLFVDARYNCPISEKQSLAFTQTSVSAQVCVNVGIIFGTNRFYKYSRFGR